MIDYQEEMNEEPTRKCSIYFPSLLEQAFFPVKTRHLAVEIKTKPALMKTKLFLMKYILHCSVAITNKRYRM